MRYLIPLKCGILMLAFMLVFMLRFMLVFMLLVTNVFANVKENTSYQKYPVQQQGDMTLLQALNNSSPVREAGNIYHAYTKWNIRWQFMWNQLPSGMCDISSVTTSLEVKMTLPEFAGGNRAFNTQFNQYLSALVLHENGHKKIGRETANTIDRLILNMPRSTSCKKLESDANQLAMNEIERAKKLEIEYDQSTEHGCTQGACLIR